MKDIGIKAKEASRSLALLTQEQKNQALKRIGDDLLEQANEIIEANQLDLEAADQNGITGALRDRLILNQARIEAMVQGLNELTLLKDPVGEVLEVLEPENGLYIEKVSVPLGVIGIIYESRPNVTVDAFGLCFKSGNAVVLKGGKEAIHTNIELERIVRNSLTDLNINPNCVQVIKDTRREVTTQLMKLNEYIDVLIPRGSASLIRAVVENSTIPVIETGAGNCHIYVDYDADISMALDIIENAKCQRLGVCNTMESLVVHKDIAPTFLPLLVNKLPHVVYHGDLVACEIVDTMVLANDVDFRKEYLDLEMSVKVVDSLEEAIAHINFYNTKHSEAIITNNEKTAQRFTQEVDASTVYVNASTRFTDGSQFGFGAEIGISTQKLHARGPMGLKQLTSYKYIVKGKGQTRV
ncbi:glutamate-5-semialdehyde dehydrogenase [Erysipelothrix rhusiopathiae]|uniref:Gamma-glutamyl phosphate reductase n=1 Tax=Erysipelothrix rhusiopathiae ATCC 19414 TaxID=525280 RepID=E7FWI0_ERYRH|nr:glutamate-5-semialdehyde dehydrogenase [Erysipelothrix rhusiopathiae]EFY08512.1 glutamate-5-semialdehyde dehydrogenase [Erysipelothrix rhusiopathiae ATCC 19414]MDE8340408.1 glutamate-5-semialdehyde dehydrogenase [Erysipelothrix rhusiopathiae]MDE8341220.1 glutamate-5-semialdehyde dehydrogenase [Erysipelothrix rhusiopathiae]RNM30075.1 glutamate-5-semialdehyde dehydrogenase [Erysipelothrix rhusiopathiae]STD09539.1 Gamma-glutamyl phosphate reductase [Erysipelothrix rhusiopathiae]